MTKLEEVARAICLAIGDDHRNGVEPEDAEKYLERCWDYWVPVARAAIEALRDLPEPIAGRLSWHFSNDNTDGDQYQVQSLWNDAIDAILKDGD